MTTAQPTRLPGLDTLRAVAIFCVIFYHFHWCLPPAFSFFNKCGWMGVDLFFVLSGYLIGSQLLKSVAAGERPALGQFYRNRAYRILPAYLVVLALYAAVPLWRESPGMSPLWEFVTFTENLFVDYSKNQAFSHVWSLCVEEHFYLLLPLIVLWLARRPSFKKTVALLAGVLLAGVVFRSYVLFHTLRAVGPGDEAFGLLYIERIYYPTWMRLDGLLAGVSLALLRIFRPAAWLRLARHGNFLGLGGAAIVGLCVRLFYDRFSSASGVAAVSTVIGYPLLSFGFALLVASAIAPGAWLRDTRIPGAKGTATLAFGLYLSHKGVAHLDTIYFPRLFETHSWTTLVLLFMTWFAAAAVLYFGVERPLLKLRDRRKALQAKAVDVQARAEPAI